VARLAIGGTTEQRFEALYRSHYLNILAYCVRRLPRADAEDAAAEVFEVAWRRSAQVPDDDDALPWLYGVTRKVLSNQLRRRRRAHRLRQRVGGLAMSSAETPEVYLLQSIENQKLIDALEKLSGVDKEILKLATWEKLSHQAIARILGISESAVGKRMSRARARLAKELERIENRRNLLVPRLTRKEG